MIMLQAGVDLLIISETSPGCIDDTSFKGLHRASVEEGDGRCQSLILAEVGGSECEISIWPRQLSAELSDITTVLSQ